MAKVRAVYEALDGRKHKLALKLLAPLLEKKPDNPQLRILKALALVRSGNKDEAVKIARELKSMKEVENDEHLLNNLAIVFREGGAPSEATECFVSAWEKQPQNEDLGLCVFAAYGKERNFLKQQQVAIRLPARIQPVVSDRQNDCLNILYANTALGLRRARKEQLAVEHSA